MKVLLLGDSLFARWEGQKEPHINYSLRQMDADLEICNLAESGDNSFDLLEKLAREHISGFDMVFVWIGANDLATHKQVYLGEFQDNLRKVVEMLRSIYLPHQVIFLGPAPIDESKQLYRTNRLVSYYSDIVEKVAKEADCLFVSMQEVFGQADYPLVDILRGSMDDGLHFGSLGYEILAQTLLIYIKHER
ncbi:hypothetical protein EII38_04005 [Streptococcus minor]|uniref:SGNH hydrolase-type esterase domain-containing protein n=1 Tax=Streptococcus minor TaxID=229549 RepID=A0A3P1VHS1_9STRE|nr:GDSL-type esterase/lipase family protein [Streptococcus minor]RRD31923.1 hypothetical protein EII38_04005 [Streptococcus minor]